MATRLFIGTEKGLFTLDSDDQRRTWKLAAPEPAHKGWQIYALYVDPRDGAIYASLSNPFFGPHLQRSRDGGETWEPIEQSPAFPEGSRRELKQIWSVAAGPKPGTLWVGVAHAALFASEDGGQSWLLNEGLEGHPTREEWAPGAGGLCLHTIVQHPSQPERVFIGISAVGIFRSDDGGSTWSVRNNGVDATIEDEKRKHTEIFRCVHKFVQDPNEPQRLYQQNHIGVFRTADGGDSWERIETGLPSAFGFPMIIHPKRARTLFVIPEESAMFRSFPGGRMAVYRSDDAGDSWKPTQQGLDEPAYGGVLRNSTTTDAHAEAGIYFGTTAGQVYFTQDDGEPWQRLPGTYPRVESLATLTR